jgi:hypothetical protein
MFHFDDICAGPIDGLALPPMAWDVLQREGIRTINQLMAKSDRLCCINVLSHRM